MKKKLLIIIGIIVLFVIGIIAYFVISDMGQEKKLKAEFTEISEMTNAENIDIDKVYERLNRTVTNGDYAEVEKSFKNYLKDNFDNTIKITELLNDERITNILTVDNYKEDGKDFIETKKYITTTREELENCKTEYIKFFTEENAMSYINDKGLDSYYIDLYRNEYVGDLESENADKTVENSINDIIDVLNIYEEIINFLADNKNSWKIDGENITFNSESLSNKYNELINKLP